MPSQPEKEGSKEKVVNITTTEIADHLAGNLELQQEIFGKVLNDKEKEQLKNKISAKMATRVMESIGARPLTIEAFEGFSKGEIQEQIEIKKKAEALDIVANINELKNAAQTKEDFQQLTKLYQKLEKLYEGGEGQELEPWLAEQYESQLEILKLRGIIFEIDSAKIEFGFDGIDGKEYAVPTPQEIAELVEQNRELIERKREQGFTKLLLVPFGRKLDELAEIYKETIVKHKKNNKLFGTKKNPQDANEALVPLELDESQPLYKWSGYNDADVNGKLVYYPESFDENHNGKTKTELLQEEGGWNILLVEDMPNIPETDPKTVGGRMQIDAFGNAMESFMSSKEVPTPKQYLQFLEQETMYSDESGMTPEDQLIYAITHLEETDQVVDDFQGNGKISYQIGAYLPSSDHVPRAYWRRDLRQAHLSRRDVDSRDDYCGVRSAVRIKKS